MSPASTRSRPASMALAIARSAAEAKTRSLRPRLAASEEPRRATGRLGFTLTSLPGSPGGLVASARRTDASAFAMRASARAVRALADRLERLAAAVQRDDAEREIS